MNERDSETIAGMLIKLGYEENRDRNHADVIVINTCSVRENADKRFFGTLGQLKNIKKARPELVVAVCGCMMQQQHVIDALKSKYPWVDLVFGTHNIHEFPSLLSNVIGERQKIVSVWDEAEDIIEGLPSRRKHSFKAYVNIMYGCNNFCTYCIVPYTRGRERSRSSLAILDEVKTLAKQGVREITLLGQNVNSYRSDDSLGFADLIRSLNQVEGLDRIRFMTSHPKDISSDLINAYKDCEKLCHHIHLPVQSGSTKVLERMNRKYSKEDYLRIIDNLRAAAPDISITTDIIVGFPGETDQDFEETLDLINKVGYDSAFTFLYSIRRGTPAEKYKDQVSEAIKHERFNRLVDLVNSISLQRNKEMKGKIVDVLAEGKSKTNADLLTGRTDGNKLVNFKAGEDVVGSIVPVFIEEFTTFSLYGKIV
jgi:tRNA-2-methylthio-N6-dimethylallyladenosine synthase